MSSQSTHRPPVVLCILDGWGERAETADNAIAAARTPTWDRLGETACVGTLEASEHFVGLPSGQMGNSEVGHMNLGAGRVVMQDLPRIDAAIESGALLEIPALTRFIERLRDSGGTVHLMGLLSPGGVHSHQDQMAALARAVADAGVPVAVHAFLDGRDTPPRSAGAFLETFQGDIAAHPGAYLASLSGRYFAMDRDKRWDRVEKAWRAIVLGDGRGASSAASGLADAYQRGENDEFVTPTVLDGYRGMRDGDGVLVANFRADRVREILASLIDPDFDGFDIGARPAVTATLGMVEYSTDLSRHHAVLFPPETLTNTLGAVVAAHGLRQLRIAETEKYAHVTFFFNGGQEAEFDGESRILVPSPDVATYDLKPEMSAPEVTDRLVAAIQNRDFDLAVVNFANTDMVGHTGDFAAAVAAVEAVDACLGRLVAAIEAAGGALLVTADHGNADIMKDPETGQPHTAHSLNPVPVRLLGIDGAAARLPTGRLCDVAPTLLSVLGLPIPPEMTGRSLLDMSVGTAAE